MANVLLVAEHDGDTLNPSTAKCASCAAEIDDAELHIAVFAAEPSAVAEQAAALDGVARVVTIAHAAHAHALAATIAPQLVDLPPITTIYSDRQRRSAKT